MPEVRAQAQATYDPAIFDVTSFAEARQIILTDEDGFDTNRRWEVETPYLAELAASKLRLDETSVVLDYGCGIGRLSKALIEKVGCWVIGVDISANMRTFAQRYIGSPQFTVVAPSMLAQLVRDRGLVFDAALSVWCFQHCLHVEEDIKLVRDSVCASGRLLVVNERGRCIPTELGWVNDGKDTLQLLEESFSLTEIGQLPTDVVSAECSARTFWACYSA